MCVGGSSPEPDINKPAYDPTQIDKNIKVTVDQPKNGQKSDAAQLSQAVYGDGPVPVTSSGLRMTNGRTQ